MTLLMGQLFVHCEIEDNEQNAILNSRKVDQQILSPWEEVTLYL